MRQALTALEFSIAKFCEIVATAIAVLFHYKFEYNDMLRG